jgi:two-component system, sensor histidine kinase and response regulator
MFQAKERVVAAIARAHADLAQALADLENMPAFDPSSIAFTAHTLQNYLTVTGGTVELLQLSLVDHPDPQVPKYLDALLHATELMTRAVHQLMNNSPTLESRLKREEVRLPFLVQRACTYYQRLAGRKQIRIIPELGTGDLVVWTDSVAVAAVLDNLLSNAIKYSPPGKNVGVKLKGEPGGVVCSVRDEGPGLSRTEQAQLFQRGVRLSPRPTAGEPSTGYGLAVAKELVERLGGSIWCDSEAGAGACFSFRLPMSEPHAGVVDSTGLPGPGG